jgi:hypothetical protein
MNHHLKNERRKSFGILIEFNWFSSLHIVTHNLEMISLKEKKNLFERRLKNFLKKVKLK